MKIGPFVTSQRSMHWIKWFIFRKTTTTTASTISQMLQIIFGLTNYLGCSIEKFPLCSSCLKRFKAMINVSICGWCSLIDRNRRLIHFWIIFLLYDYEAFTLNLSFNASVSFSFSLSLMLSICICAVNLFHFGMAISKWSVFFVFAHKPKYHHLVASFCSLFACLLVLVLCAELHGDLRSIDFIFVFFFEFVSFPFSHNTPSFPNCNMLVLLKMFVCLYLRLDEWPQIPHMIDVGKKWFLCHTLSPLHAYHFHFQILRSCFEMTLLVCAQFFFLFHLLVSPLSDRSSSCNCVLKYHRTFSLDIPRYIHTHTHSQLRKLDRLVHIVVLRCALCLICSQFFIRGRERGREREWPSKMLLKTRFNWALTPWLRFIIILLAYMKLTQLVAVAKQTPSNFFFRSKEKKKRQK